MSVALVSLALIIVIIFEIVYFRRRRREKAILNAIDQVERAADKGSEERIVLESRVSIVFQEDPDEEEYDGDGEEEERGRAGMSLPRRRTD